jgi:hypothetical protein
MSVTIQDATTADVLGRTVGTEIEVYGPDGRLLGRFTPAPRPGMSFPEIGMSDEELARVKDDPSGWATADEVNALLRSLRGSK